MAKGYWINQSDVTDEAGHAVYAKAVVEYLARRGAKTLVFSQAGRREVVEGSPRSRQLIQEFPDYETALAAYHSEEYQEIKKLRRNTATIDLVIAEGFDAATQEQPDPEEQVMPEVVFVSTLEPKDGRRDELVELLAELAKHIRGEPGYLQYSVHRPLGEDKGPLLVIQRYTSLEAYQEHSSWARGQVPRISEFLATPPGPPVLFEPVPLGDDAAK